MFQCALGRVHSEVVLPSESLNLFVYIDAGGWAKSKRVWGGLAAFGRLEDNWIDRKIHDLGIQHPHARETTGELKGRRLDLGAVVDTGRLILSEGRRMCFWSNWYPKPDQSAADDFLRAFGGIRAARWRLDASRIQARNDAWAGYLERLKPVNRWKVFSLLAHLQWLVQEIRRTRVGHQLSRVELLVDREALPSPAKAGELVKTMFAASLQHAGMSLAKTGRAYEETPQEGAVRVDMDANSAVSSGLQLVDVLLQAVQRRLPGYGSRRHDDAAHG